MRTQKRNGTNGAADAGMAAPAPAPAAPNAAPAPLVVPDIEIRVAPRDLWFFGTALRMTPWAGGEARVMGLRNIYKTCRLKTIDLRVLPTAQPTTPVEVIRLPHADVELLIQVMCGGGGNQAFGGDPGPEMSELVARLRETVKDAIKTAVAAKAKTAARA